MSLTLQELVKAGVHFGHQKSRWNPRMKPFIYGKKKGMHIIDLRETLRGLFRGANLLSRLAQTGGEILIVGTKHQVKNLVKSEASRVNAHYVSERWLGGTLTNYKTIRERLKRLEEIEELERTGEIQRFSKKMVSQISREKRKLLRNLEGIRNMTKKPDAIVIIDPRREHIAVAEAVKLKIPTVCIVDTDSNPEKIDIVIPANDDSFRSVQILLRYLVDAAQKGKVKRDASLGLTSMTAAPVSSSPQSATSAETTGTTHESSGEDPKAEGAKPDEAKAEDKPDEAKTEEAPKAEEAKTEEAPKAEEPKAEETKAEAETPAEEPAKAEATEDKS